MISASHSPRRGVLLLVVLSMLTLFLMLGVTYLVAASRARKVARAYASAAGSSLNAVGIAPQLLDEAFLAVVRATTAPSGSIEPGDDLLGDRYGKNSPDKGVLSSNVSGTTILNCAVTGLSDAQSLAGRVLSFTLPGIPGASTRIIRATDNGGVTTIYFPGGRTISGVTLSAATINAAKASPQAGPTHILVNNRDFDNSAGNEPYDAFDADNAFLAQVTGTSAIPSYSISGTSTAIDNDGDGRPDSGWLDVGLPRLVDASGNILQPKAAILVVDLDGRINLNTHGSNIDLATTESATDFAGGGGDSKNLYPNELVYSGTVVSGTIQLSNLPRGMGVGTAEVSLAATDVTGAGGAPGLPNVLAGLPLLSQSDTTSETRPRPLIGQPEGRYGDTPMAATEAPLLSVAKPGLPDTDDNREIDRWVSSGTGALLLGGTSAPARFFDDAYTRYGSPPDIKGRLRLWVDRFGQPVYFKPAWGFDAALTYNGRSADDDETTDDPYEINLGPTGPKNGWIHDPKPFPTGAQSFERDTPFNATELEGVLRFYDPDTLKLPRRMVSLLGASAANGRLTVTSDSWDTPAVVGTAWADVIANQFATATTSVSGTSGAKPYELFAPETLMGHKLDLNRPFHALSGTPDTREPMGANSGASFTGEQLRQQFAKHLYCLFTAIATKNKTAALTPAEAEQIAQWAVNIVDFRDGDSIMTQFNYDETFTIGSTTWNATKRVWGCERPEILITETIAWHDRCTDDTASDSTGHAVIDQDPTVADNDFDQRRRPRGAFFIELYSPWGSQAKQFVSGTTPVDVYRSGTNSQKLRGEPLPLELTGTATDRFSRNAAITLQLRHDRSISNQDSATESPIWRLVSVRGDVKTSGTTFGADGFGIDPVRPSVSGTTPGTLSILDPSRPKGATAVAKSGTAVIDRIFYFTPPPAAQRAEANGHGQTGCIFWESGTSSQNPSQQNYVVFGTDQLSPTNMTATVNSPTVDRVFNRPLKRPATLSEPIATGTATTVTGTAVPNDAYQLLTTSGTFQSGANIYDASYTLNATLDQPLDAATSHPPTVTAPFLDKEANPLLMQNGRHANFAIIHLQRLADPSREWQSDDSLPNYNPYLTVDSMPVDLVVVNNGTSGNTTGNLDEPGETPFDPPYDPNTDTSRGDALTWLRTRKEYDQASVERGGKTTDRPAPEKDIWNRKINVSGTASLSVLGDSVFRSGTAANDTTTVYTPPPFPNPGNATGDIAERNIGGTTTLQSRPARFLTDRQPWLHWPNRPLNSPAELASVPTTSSFHLLRMHTTGTTSSTAAPAFAHLPGILESGTAVLPWRYLYTPVTSGSSQPSVFDFVHVPTRFTGSYVTLPVTTLNTAALGAHGLASQPYNHLSLFREPGRININTAPSNDIKTAILGKQDYDGAPPTWKSGIAWNWMQATAQANTTYTDPPRANRATELDSFFRFETAGRLSNTVTPRSNIFAIWITIGYFPVGQNQELQNQELEPLKRHRGFYIYDRSIPVGYEPGKNNNVRDGILLRRIIQ